MHYRQLGVSGRHISGLVLAVPPDRELAPRLIDVALDEGVNLIDAPGPVAEEIVGGCLRGRRDNLMIETRVGLPSGDRTRLAGVVRSSLVRSVNESLRRLRTDRVDLLCLHRWDGVAPLDDALLALDELIRAGKVRHTGLSEFSAAQVTTVMSMAGTGRLIPPTAVQVCCPSDLGGTVYAAVRAGLGTLVRCPLRPGRPGADRGVREVFAPVAAWRGVTVAQAVLAWLQDRFGVTGVVVGASGEDELRERLAAADLELSEDETRRIDQALLKGQAPHT